MVAMGNKHDKKYWKRLYKQAEWENGLIGEALRDTGRTLTEARDEIDKLKREVFELKDQLGVEATQSTQYLQERNELSDALSSAHKRLDKFEERKGKLEARYSDEPQPRHAKSVLLWHQDYDGEWFAVHPSDGRVATVKYNDMSSMWVGEYYPNSLDKEIFEDWELEALKHEIEEREAQNG